MDAVEKRQPAVGFTSAPGAAMPSPLHRKVFPFISSPAVFFVKRTENEFLVSSFFVVGCVHFLEQHCLPRPRVAFKKMILLNTGQWYFAGPEEGSNAPFREI